MTCQCYMYLRINSSKFGEKISKACLMFGTNVVCYCLCLLVPALNPNNLHSDSIAERIFS